MMRLSRIHDPKLQTAEPPGTVYVLKRGMKARSPACDSRGVPEMKILSMIIVRIIRPAGRHKGIESIACDRAGSLSI